jgi:hypothetical protein
MFFTLKAIEIHQNSRLNAPPFILLCSFFNELDLDSYITIGGRYWDDYIYCEMPYENIERELNSPDLNNSIKAHIWLTLSDGTIIDCTAETDNVENAKSGYHRPYLIGADFLLKTGVCEIFYE